MEVGGKNKYFLHQTGELSGLEHLPYLVQSPKFDSLNHMAPHQMFLGSATARGSPDRLMHLTLSSDISRGLSDEPVGQVC